jgi:dipeptidyl aminopeptidase/acylaminoacyl peptidase
MKGYDTKPQVSADGKTIYWLSMAREGYESDKNDLIAYDVSSKTKTNLTAKWDNTAEDYSPSADRKRMYLLAYYQGTEHVFTMDLPTGKKNETTPSPKQLTTGDFDIASIVGVTTNALVVTRTDMNHAPELYTVDITTGAVQQLTHVNDDAYAKIGMCKIEKRWITTTDKQKMMTWVVYPPDFDPSKKYPALLYCQGGPQSALSQFYSFRWNFQLMASKGYIVIAPNRRGMPGHGVRWNESISKDWGGQAIRDYLTATDSIGALPFVDKTRIGAVGASYGGYSVYMLAGVHNNRFKTFISHCGLFNLKSWYGTTEEMWFANWDVGGPYWEKNNEGLYEKADPINFAQNWNKPILVIHGGKDFRVPENQGMEAFQLAQLKGLKSRLLLFPEEGHWVSQPQNGLLWQREFYKWLDETL